MASASPRSIAARASTPRDSASQRKRCNCKNSKCLKLYCECFASGKHCDGCNCAGCENDVEHASERQAAIEQTLERNPNAFRPKIVNQTTSGTGDGAGRGRRRDDGGEAQSRMSLQTERVLEKVLRVLSGGDILRGTVSVRGV